MRRLSAGRMGRAPVCGGSVWGHTCCSLATGEGLRTRPIVTEGCQHASFSHPYRKKAVVTVPAEQLLCLRVTSHGRTWGFCSVMWPRG